MILDLLRRDHAARTLPWVLPAGAIVGASAWAMYRLLRTAPGALPELHLYLVIMAWLALVSTLVVPASYRCSRFDLTLPIAAARSWLAHTVALVAGGLLVLVTVGAVIALGNALQGHRPLLERDLLGVGARLVAGFLLAMAVLQSPRPSLHRIPFRWSYVLLVVGVAFGGAGLVVLLTRVSILYTLLPLGAALGVGWRTYRALPAGFVLLPRAADASPTKPRRERVRLLLGLGVVGVAGIAALSSGVPAYFMLLLLGLVILIGYPTLHPLLQTLISAPPAPGDSEAAPQGGEASSRGVQLPARRVRVWRFDLWMLQSLVTAWGLFYVAVFAALGVLLTGYYLPEDMLLLLAGTLAFLLSNWVTLAASRLRVLDALPVSRRRSFGLVMATCLLPLGVAFGLGDAVGRQRERQSELVSFCRDRSHSCFQIPARFLAVSWTGNPPALDSPWGESHRPNGTPLVKGSRAVVYSPYDTPPGSSANFVALQLSRALEAVYGRRIPPDELRERYLSLDESGRAVAATGALALLADYPGLEARAATGRILMMLLVVGVPVLFFLAVVLRLFRAVLPAGDVKRFSLTLALVFIALAIGQVVAAETRALEPWVTQALAEILALRLSALPLVERLALWGATGLLLVAAYRSGEAQYRRLEAPAVPDPKREFLEQVGLGA